MVLLRVWCVGSGATNYFVQYLEHTNIFSDKNTLTANFLPQRIHHRDREIQQLSLTLAPLLRGYPVSNVFLYGTCGTGKTVTCRSVLSQLEGMSRQQGVAVRALYVNCKMKKVADTEYRLFAQLIRLMGGWVPDTGLPTDVLYRRFFSMLDGSPAATVLVLDEIDALFQKIGDEFLYNLTRINNELRNTRISIIGITNNTSFRDGLDQRVKSSLSEEEIVFKPYNAPQLRDILMERIPCGFVEHATTEEAVSKCAALAAQEHGDARRALDLLRVAGEVAERMGDTQVTEVHVNLAEEKLDMDRVMETIKSQPAHSQAVLYAILMRSEGGEQWADRRVLSGDVYKAYNELCAGNGMRALTQRRISDLVEELGMLGIISSHVISKGRYGRTKEIALAIDGPLVDKIRGVLTSRFS